MLPKSSLISLNVQSPLCLPRSSYTTQLLLIADFLLWDPRDWPTHNSKIWPWHLLEEVLSTVPSMWHPRSPGQFCFISHCSQLVPLNSSELLWKDSRGTSHSDSLTCLRPSCSLYLECFLSPTLCKSYYSIGQQWFSPVGSAPQVYTQASSWSTSEPRLTT